MIDAFIARGALVSAITPQQLNFAWSNAPAMTRLVESGLPLEGMYEFSARFASRGDVAVPLFEALHRRGFAFSHANHKSDATLLGAVNALSPQLVDRLITFGAADDPSAARRALLVAENIKVRQIVGIPCLHCDLAPNWYRDEDRRLNAPDVLQERGRRRSEIIALLKAVLGSPP